MSHAIYLKVAGWNLLRAVMSGKLAEMMAQGALRGFRTGSEALSGLLGPNRPVRGCRGPMVAILGRESDRGRNGPISHLAVLTGASMLGRRSATSAGADDATELVGVVALTVGFRQSPSCQEGSAESGQLGS